MSVAQSSIDSHHQNKVEVYPTKRAHILEAIRTSGGINRREIKDLTGYEINCVAGRCNELLADEEIEVQGERKCSTTGRMTEILVIAGTVSTSGDDYKYKCLISHVASKPVEKISEFLTEWEAKHKDGGKLREAVREKYRESMR